MSDETIRLACPADMEHFVRKVLEGEYNVPGLEFTRPLRDDDGEPIDGASEPYDPVVLDIGANVGAFAMWAMKRWPGCTVECYEPHPENFATLKRNLDGRVGLWHRAVRGNDEFSWSFIYDGMGNSGTASVYRENGTAHAVSTMHARSLPFADVLKLDCEGCEAEILEGYPHLRHVRAVLVEYHSPELRCRVDAACTKAGLALFECRVYCAVSGVMKFVRPA